MFWPLFMGRAYKNIIVSVCKEIFYLSLAYRLEIKVIHLKMACEAFILEVREIAMDNPLEVCREHRFAAITEALPFITAGQVIAVKAQVSTI